MRWCASAPYSRRKAELSSRTVRLRTVLLIHFWRTQLLQLVQTPWPVVFEQTRQGTIRQQLAAGLAFRAVISFVVGVDDALHRRAAHWTGFAVFAVHRHLVAKRRDALGKIFAGLFAQTLDPFAETIFRRLEERFNLAFAQLLGLLHRRQSCAVENFVGISIANTAKQMRIGERSFERVILPRQRGTEGI